MKMKKVCVCAVVMAIVVILASAAHGQRVAPSTYPSANVMDYGAKGDGGTDDTEAIRKAFEAVLPRRGGGLMPWIGEVVFPAGHYVISEPLALGAGAEVALGLLLGQIAAQLAQQDVQVTADSAAH